LDRTIERKTGKEVSLDERRTKGGKRRKGKRLTDRRVGIAVPTKVFFEDSLVFVQHILQRILGERCSGSGTGKRA
jgi:hypothetical protein